MTTAPSPLYCPYLIKAYNQDRELIRQYCVSNHQTCLIDDSALTRENCTRRAFLDALTREKQPLDLTKPPELGGMTPGETLHSPGSQN